RINPAGPIADSPAGKTGGFLSIPTILKIETCCLSKNDDDNKLLFYSFCKKKNPGDYSLPARPTMAWKTGVQYIDNVLSVLEAEDGPVPETAKKYVNQEQYCTL